MSEHQIRICARTLESVGPITLGPAPFFRLEGPLLVQGPGNEIVARYTDHHWELQGQYCSSYECTDGAFVCFQDRQGQYSGPLGPFDKVRFPNGTCYADQEHLAQFIIETERWRECATGARWPAILISSAGQ